MVPTVGRYTTKTQVNFRWHIMLRLILDATYRYRTQVIKAAMSAIKYQKINYLRF